MTTEPPLSVDDERLLAELRVAVEEAPARPTQIEVGIALSITLGRLRPAVACGGCSTPLEFDLNAPDDARVIAVNALRDKLLGRETLTREH